MPKNINTKIVNCPNPALKFKCDKKWSDLKINENPKKAFCDECKKDVYLCESIKEYELNRDLGHCVAIPLKPVLFEAFRSGVPETTHALGYPSMEEIQKSRKKDFLNLKRWWDKNVQSNNE